MEFNSLSKIKKVKYLMDIFFTENVVKLQLILNYSSIFSLKFMDNRWNIIHLCCYYDNYETLSWILEKPAAQKLINEKDNNLEIPLHWACINNNRKIIDLLIKSGSELDIQNNNKLYPFDLINDYLEREKLIKLIVLNNNNINDQKTEFLSNYLNNLKNTINMKSEQFRLKEQKRQIKDNKIILNILKVNNIKSKQKNNKVINDLNLSVEKFLSNNDISEIKQLEEFYFNEDQLLKKKKNPFIKIKEFYANQTSFLKTIFGSLIKSINKNKDEVQNKKEKEFFYRELKFN